MRRTATLACFLVLLGAAIAQHTHADAARETNEAQRRKNEELRRRVDRQGEDYRRNLELKAINEKLAKMDNAEAPPSPVSPMKPWAVALPDGGIVVGGPGARTVLYGVTDRARATAYYNALVAAVR